MLPGEPFSNAVARDLVRKILAAGSVSFSGHALTELKNDKMTTQDAENVLRGGWVEAAELERGSYRYRVVTQRMAVVVAFRSEAELRVVTAWRMR